jgi:ketosteroid isomerase-like protein
MTDGNVSLKKDLVKRFLQAIAERDTEAFRRVLREDVVWHVPPSTMPEFAGPHHGVDKAIELLTGVTGKLFVEHTQVIEILSLIVDVDQSASRFRMKARTVSGRDYDCLYGFFFRYSEDKIAEIWEVADTAYVYGIFDVNPTWVRGE